MKTSILTPWQWKNLRNKANVLNEKNENQSYSYGCIMGYLKSVSEVKVNDEDIYDNDEKEYGREIEPHVTVLYGLHDDEIDEDEVIELLKSLKLPSVKLSAITSFDNEKFDVLKWDVESEQLNLYNKIVTLLFPFTSKFPDYHAHATIAYLKPGTSKTYHDTKLKDTTAEIEKWVYSKADGKKISIDSEGNVEIMREAREEKIEENINNNLYFDKSTNKVKEFKSKEKEDESYDYKGYHIELHQNKRILGEFGHYSYNCRVLKEGEYKMGLRGPVSLQKGKEAAELFINGQTK